MEKVLDYLGLMKEDKASDLFIMAGTPVCEKCEGRQVYFNGTGRVTSLAEAKKLSPDETEILVQEIYQEAKRDIARFKERGDDDFALSVPNLARFRVNVYKQRNSMAAVLRMVSYGIPDPGEMSIDEERVMKRVTNLSSGLVLITGTAGSGKSTTQACIIDRINQDPEKNYHIITLEDPVEYLHRNKYSIVSQREIGIDAQDYQSGLRACLRQAPDVILLGEMRDQETIRTVMTAAETGHLVIATLHTSSAINAVDRIVDTFPEGQQPQIRMQLSSVLKTVIAQRLLRGTDGRLIPSFEIMNATTAVKNIIRMGKTDQLRNTIASGKDDGMITMDKYIQELLGKGKITKETAEKALEE